MHIPDGFIDGKTAVVAAAVSVVGLSTALARLRATLPPRRVPLIGLTAAFIFAAQMLNFPVAGGTSGHLVGAVLAAVLLGPGAAVLVMSSVLILQCFMFADGGVTALGANMFNMALIAPVAGYGVYALVLHIAGQNLRARLFAVAFASWCSTVAASIGCAGQLALSGAVEWHVALPTMVNIHMLIGIGEAFITTLVIAAIARVRPELLSESSRQDFKAGFGEMAVYGLLVSIGLAAFVAPFACKWPDGLEKAAAVLGFGGKAAEQPVFPSPFPDYHFPGFGNERLSMAVIGAAGTLTAFILAYALARFLTPEERR